MTRATSSKANGSPAAAKHSPSHSHSRSQATGNGARDGGATAGGTAVRDETCGPEEHARRARTNNLSEEQLERAAAIFRAAGDVSRLKLLHRLCDGEWCVTELADAAGVGLSTVSQQLRLLRAERIVARRRAGKHIFYSLADAHVIDLIQGAIDHAGHAGDAHHSHDHEHERETEADE